MHVDGRKQLVAHDSGTDGCGEATRDCNHHCLSHVSAVIERPDVSSDGRSRQTFVQPFFNMELDEMAKRRRG